MTREDLEKEFLKFIEFPAGSEKKYILTISAILFAEHIAREAELAERKACAKVCDMHDCTVYKNESIADVVCINLEQEILARGDK